MKYLLIALCVIAASYAVASRLATPPAASPQIQSCYSAAQELPEEAQGDALEWCVKAEYHPTEN